jgi:DNA-binding transcriptional ArsR family regulator
MAVLEGVCQTGPCNASELGSCFDKRAESLHYHLRCLAEAELITEKEMKQKTGKRLATVLAANVPGGEIFLEINPDSEVEMHRFHKMRSLWVSKMRGNILDNFDSAVKKGDKKRIVFFNLWVLITVAQREKIESLFNEIKEVLCNPTDDLVIEGLETVNMQYAFWMIEDYEKFVPLPEIKARKKAPRVMS